MLYHHARKLADRIVELLVPQCETLHIAGSVRREKEEVKDIEIVCMPKRIISNQDLFGKGESIVHPDFTAAVTSMTKTIVKGSLAKGRYIQLVLKGGETLDLFLPDPADYYRQLAIRTGSAEYSAFVIGHAWRKNGWCGTDQGLRKYEDCIGDSGNWKCINPNAEKPPVWKSEEEFFEWISVKWISPNLREVK
jgi:DNA polymerase/3'-5' exonuclease PolX